MPVHIVEHTGTQLVDVCFFVFVMLLLLLWFFLLALCARNVAMSRGMFMHTRACAFPNDDHCTIHLVSCVIFHFVPE